MTVFDALTLSDKDINQLIQQPDIKLETNQLGVKCTLGIILKYYGQSVDQYFAKELSDSRHMPQFFSTNTFEHLGLNITFEEPLELPAYNHKNELLGNVRELIKQFGVITFSNVYLSEKQRDEGHRNRFPHLHFHRDRNEFQPTPYSLFCRNPFDEEQKHPRLSSTLFTTYKVIYLELLREGKPPLTMEDQQQRSHYDVFKDKDSLQGLKNEFQHIILEYPWNAPEGTGELTMMDNRTLLHASYYRHSELGYRIGVRYLK